MIELKTFVPSATGMSITSVDIKCENCEHWKKDYPPSPDMGICTKLRGCDWHTFYVEGSDIETFNTHKDFGCALFSSSDPLNKSFDPTK